MGRFVFAIALVVAVLNAPARTGPLGDQVPDLTPDALSNWTTVANYPLMLTGLAASSNGTSAFVAGGWTAPNPTNAFNRYDIPTNAWTPLAALPAPLTFGASAYASVNNKVYVFGGFQFSSCALPLTATYIYDVGSNSWTTGAPMPESRYAHAAVYYAATGKIYVIGGFKSLGMCIGDEATQTWEYDPVANTWNTTRAAIPVAVGNGAASIVGQFIYLAGSHGNNDGTTRHYRYDIVNDVWAQMAPVPVPVRNAASAAIGGETYVVGGFGAGTNYKSTFIYNIASNSWRNGPNTSFAHYAAGGAALGNRLIVVGGFDGTNRAEMATSNFLGTGLLVGDAMSIGDPVNNFGYLATNLVNYTFANSRIAANEFAVFQTHDPSGSTVLKNAITGASHTFNVFTPAQLSGFNFGAYRIVVLNFDEHFVSDFATPYTAAITALQNYVRSGGVVWVQGAIKGSGGESFTLPFGGTATYDTSTSDVVIDPISPLVAGAPDPITGTVASTATFAALPGGAHPVVTKTNAGGPPTFYELRLRRVPFDTNRDLLADRTVFRPSNGAWYTALSNGGATITGWGTSTDIDVMGDYDGDGKADLAVFRPSSGLWFIVQSTNGSVRVVGWGTSGDIPLTGDVDGDGRDDVAVFRPSAGAWFILPSNGSAYSVAWGAPGGSDVPLLADYDGDGKADVTIFRSTTGVWYVLKSSGGTTTTGWGAAGDIPVVGNFDGDAKTDLTIFRPSNGQWWVSPSTGGTFTMTWGVSGDTPIACDFDGDGRDDFTIYRNGVWYTLISFGGSAYVGWGVAGDRPVGRTPGT